MESIHMSHRPNKPKQVYKFNSDGLMVHEYEGITVAVKNEHVSHTKMARLITYKEKHNGCYFSSYPTLNGIMQETKKDASLEPWESEDGMFDIQGWGKVCL